jgi:hypothetical protein
MHSKVRHASIVRSCASPPGATRAPAGDVARSAGRVATVDDEFTAGDELRLVRGEVENAVGDVVWLSHVADRV